jgi:uncharacterized integral membrane protein
MTQPAAPPRATSTLPPPISGSARPPPAAPQPARRAALQTPAGAMRTPLIAGLAAPIAGVIFTIQNVDAANISFPGVHLVLPLAVALLLAAVVGSLLTIATGPARITRLRQVMGRGLRKARTGTAAPAAPASPLEGQSAGTCWPMPSRPAQHLPAHLTD